MSLHHFLRSVKFCPIALFELDFAVLSSEIQIVSLYSASFCPVPLSLRVESLARFLGSGLRYSFFPPPPFLVSFFFSIVLA